MPRINKLTVSNRPISRGEIMLRHRTPLPIEIIRYIFDFWFGDDVSQLIIDWKKRMKPESDELNTLINEQIERQYNITGGNTHIDYFADHHMYDDITVLFPVQETLYNDTKKTSSGIVFKYEIRNNLKRVLTIKNIKRELIIYRRLFNDNTFDTSNTYYKYRIAYGKRHKSKRYDVFGNPDETVDLKLESGLTTLPVTVKRKDNKKRIEVYSKSDFKQSNTKELWQSRFGKQSCDKLSSKFIQLWKQGIVEPPNNKHVRHLLLTNKSGKKYVKTVPYNSTILKYYDDKEQKIIKITKNTKNTKNTKINKNNENDDLYTKTGQELRDILSYLTNKPTGLKSSGNLKTKQAIIDKIVELRNSQVVFV